MPEFDNVVERDTELILEDAGGRRRLLENKRMLENGEYPTEPKHELDLSSRSLNDGGAAAS